MCIRDSSSAALWCIASPTWGQVYTTGGQLIPGTAGLTPGPGVDLSGFDTPGHVLEQANLSNINLTGATIANSDVALAAFTSSNLTSVNFTGAIINGADLGSVTGLTSAQIDSTASYASGDLDSVGLEGNDLTGWSFANVNLSNSNLEATTLTLSLIHI